MTILPAHPAEHHVAPMPAVDEHQGAARRQRPAQQR